jgi:hypothetical protein
MFKWVGRVPAWLWFLLALFAALSGLAASNRAAELGLAAAEWDGQAEAADVRDRLAALERNEHVRLLLNIGLTAVFVFLGLARRVRVAVGGVSPESSPPAGDHVS